MEPSAFREANRNLTPPADWDRDKDGDCGDLPTFTDGHTCISRWRLSWRERLTVLLSGAVWLGVLSGHTQPPVWIAARKPFARREQPSARERWLAFIGAAILLFALAFPATAQEPPADNPNDGPFSVSLLAGGSVNMTGADDTVNVRGEGWIQAEMPLGWARPYARLGITSRPEETLDLSNIATYSAAEAGFGIERALARTSDGKGRIGLTAEGGFSSIVSGEPSEKLARYAFGGFKFAHADGGEIVIGYGMDEQAGPFGWGQIVGYGSLPIGATGNVFVITGDFTLSLQQTPNGLEEARDVFRLGVMLDLGRAAKAIESGATVQD